MQRLPIIFACSVTLGLSSIALAGDGAAPDGKSNWVHGDGESAENWSQVDAAFAKCDSGAMQSPINVDKPNATGEVDLAVSYGNSTGKLKTGQAKVQLDFPAGMGMISGETLFSLKQLHFHTPAEHVMDGKRYPLTVHLVHASAGGKLAVLGVMFEEGEANPALQSIIAAMKGGKDTAQIDVGDVVPDDLDIIRYMGSLTTPPCSEGVNWHVAQKPISASRAQIKALHAQMGKNARSLQPAGNRLIVDSES